MNKKHVYVDMSAYLCLILNEAESNRIAKLLDGAQVYTSSLLFLEAARNILRLARQNFIDESEYVSLLARLGSDTEFFATRDFTLDLALDPRFPAISIPKTLDLAHLKTALWFQKSCPELTLLSLDKRQIVAAKEMGLVVAGLR